MLMETGFLLLIPTWGASESQRADMYFISLAGFTALDMPYAWSVGVQSR